MPVRGEVRGTAEIVEGTRVRFTCEKGHVQIEDLGRKSLPARKRMSENAVRLAARWWRNGVNYSCRKCNKDLTA